LHAVTATFLTVKLPLPLITVVRQSASVWRAGSVLAFITRNRRPPIGTVFSFDLNEQAKVTLTFTQRRAGRKVHGNCVAQNRNNKRKPRCTRTLVAGTLKLAAHKGANHIHFQGRLSHPRTLKPGRYTLAISASNAARQRTTSRSLSFTIVK
jgi:hypothetical protein